MKTACTVIRPASFLAAYAGVVVMTFVGEDQAGPDLRKKTEQPKLPACTDRPARGPSS